LGRSAKKGACLVPSDDKCPYGGAGGNSSRERSEAISGEKVSEVKKQETGGIAT